MSVLNPKTHQIMIFYISGTGNTRWAANLISERTGEKLIDISKETNKQHEYKLEEQFLKHFNIRVDGNKLAPTLTNRFFNSQTPLIRQLCEDDGIQLKEEKNYNYLKLTELLCENNRIRNTNYVR